ncbi:MAG: succinylglutamate desuccinylase/aspartoacylase family protein [Gammaproteobacteria bacterium]
MREPIIIGDVVIKAGQKKIFDLPLPALYTHTEIGLPVHVIHSKIDGPVMFISAALHGDEINGVEIIRRVLKSRSLGRLKGTLIAVPVVNLFGFISQTRYLPDRRDLNRSFPGSEKGSMAARLANIFLKEIVQKCTHGIDLHTAAVHRDNLPQVRAYLKDKETERMAMAFYAPVILNTNLVEGSLRQSVNKMKIPVLVYEAGEALRFHEGSIRAGVKGIISVMREIGMLPKLKKAASTYTPMVAKSSIWVRAPKSGILRSMVSLGTTVKKNDILGIVSDPFGEVEEQVFSAVDGIIIGRTNIPLVNEGEALFHIATFRQVDKVADRIEEFNSEIDPATDNRKPSEPPIA